MMYHGYHDILIMDTIINMLMIIEKTIIMVIIHIYIYIYSY